jgi:branched-chain amino acid aminotransferase
MTNYLIYLNGAIIPEKKAMVCCLDPGFLYGHGLFETMRSYEGRVFQLDAHLNRLLKSMPAVHINARYSISGLREAVNLTLEANGLMNAYIRLNIWQGQNNQANVCIITKEFKGYPDDFYRKGFKAKVSQYRHNESSLLANIKSFNYLQFYLSRIEAEKESFNEVIFLNSKRRVCEGSRSNIFLIKDKTVITPSLNSGCLNGITRRVAIDLAIAQRYKVYEREVLLDELFKSDEVFLTSSLLEIMPLTYIEQKPINSGLPGEMTLYLLKIYRKLTKVSQQI